MSIEYRTLMSHAVLAVCIVAGCRGPQEESPGSTVEISSDMRSESSLPMTNDPATASSVPEPNRYSLDVVISNNSKQPEDIIPAARNNITESWSVLESLLILLIGAVVTWSVRRIPSCRGKCLHLAFAASFAITSVPFAIFRAIGVLGIVTCGVCLLHITVPRPSRANAVFVGIGLAFFAYAFAVAGVLVTHTDMPLLERYSTAFYEATQLPLMNMSVHDEITVNSEARSYFTTARFLACLLALYLAYQTVLYFWNLASTQCWLLYYRFNCEKTLSLVIGIGNVGLELIRDLRLQGHRVIAVEINEDATGIDEARTLGARIVIGDAVDSDLYWQLPFDAIDSAYVVAGDDQKNIEIGQSLRNFSAQKVAAAGGKAPDHTKPPARKSWWNWIEYCRWRCCLQNHQAVCYVQLYDVNMQRILEQEHHGQKVSDADVEMRHFNANQNAVRDFIQNQLSRPEVRPDKEDEVALYLLIGFEQLGQEVASGLAQLAHFNNHRRSRIVIFSKTPAEDSQTFLARYPGFSDTAIIKDWGGTIFITARDDWNYRSGSADVNATQKYGVDFVTNAIFTNLPASAGQPDFLELIHRLTSTTDNVHVKPALIVCDSDWKRSFAWSSEFCASWKAYCCRKKLAPFIRAGTTHPALPTFFWLQRHRAIRDLVRDNPYQIPFGLEEQSISKSLLDAELLSHLGAVVQYSYQLARSVPGSTEANAASKLTPLSYRDLKSNLNAAAHALIKYQVAGQDIDWLAERKTWQFPALATIPSFNFHGTELRDQTVFDPNESGLVVQLSETEHNRWMAEQLMQGYKWIETEPARDADGKRLPEAMYLRSTLCPWNQLPVHEALKDVRQTYYVLYHLHKLQTDRSIDNSACGNQAHSRLER